MKSGLFIPGRWWEFFCEFYFPLSSERQENYEMKEEHGDKERHLHVMKTPEPPSVHYIRKGQGK